MKLWQLAEGAGAIILDAPAQAFKQKPHPDRSCSAAVDGVERHV
jgi:hypothetical protein